MRNLTCKLGAFCIMAIFCIATNAQEMITVSPNSAMTQNVPTLNGKAGVVFLANTNDMVIISSINKDPQPKAVKDGNQYRYEMVIDISASDRRDFIVSKYGTTNSYKIEKITLYPNKKIYFNVDQVENGIDIKKSTTANAGWIKGKGGEALIVFNSKIKLNINYPNLKLKDNPIRHGRSVAGTYLDSLIIDTEQFKKLASQEDSLSEVLKTAERNFYNNLETLDDSVYNALKLIVDSVPKKIDSVSYQLADLLKIEVSGEKTNKITIDYNDIKTLTPTGLLEYNIIILNETKVVVETQYGELLRQADNEFRDRQYVRAANFYRLAADEKGISDEQRNVAIDKASAALRYDTIYANAEKYAKLINDIVSNKGEVKKTLLIKAFDQAILAYRSLANSTDDPYFKKQMEKLIAEKEKIGIVLEGTTYYSELHQGVLEESALGGCKFYGVKGAVSDDMRSNVYWSNGDKLSTSNSDGTFKFQIMVDQYDYIIVVGARNGKIRANKIIPMKGRGDSKLKIVFGKK